MTRLAAAFLTLGCLLVASPTQPPSPAPATAARAPLITFDKYHTYTEILAFLRGIVARHPSRARLVPIGASRAGRPIFAVEINNPVTGPAAEKPAFYIDGNIHGGEVLSGEAALYLIHRLLERGRADAAPGEIVDTRAFYVVPIVNPDGREISVNTPENHRWNIRPVDEDADGRVDEDPPEDLDRDGRILQMRVVDPAGEWKASVDDPRLLARRAAGEQGGTYYRTYQEGHDNDGDGRFNEDRVGGVDVNRNFPSNWHPAQFASGPYPLSEPESRALVDYITARPNIAAVHTFHTSGGMILRFPTLGDQDWDFPEEDIRDYDAIARRGVELTGYDNYGNDKKPIVDRMNPGHGVFNDWASNVYGVLAMTTEMWKHPGQAGGKALLDWNDKVLGGLGFIAWRAHRHPQLGRVELGGWDRWSTASPPEPLIEAELERNARWVLTFAERLPRVVIVAAQATPVGGTPNAFDVEARVANVGWMATATAHAARVLKTARPVVARVALTNAEIIDEPGAEAPAAGERSLGVLAGARENGPIEVPVRWRVRLKDPAQPARVEIVVASEKAGTARRRVRLTAKTGT